MNQPHLFCRGILTREPSLSDMLDAHKRRTLDQIKTIPQLDRLTDEFLAKLVKDSLVEPVTLHLDKMTQKLRTEEREVRSFFDDERQVRPQTVACISIPFSGDPALFERTPDRYSLSFPIGEVCGKRVQFDMTLPSSPDRAASVKQDIQSNISSIETYTKAVNEQVKAFNESLPAVVKEAFVAKLAELSKQISILDDLGIKAEEPEKPAPLRTFSQGVVPKPHGSRRRQPTQIIQVVENLYVQELNQTNNNTGDVNNAIQSN